MLEPWENSELWLSLVQRFMSPEPSGMTSLDHAVDAFSRAFSNSPSLRPQHLALCTARGRTTIHDLPAEVLCVIFSFAFANVYRHHRRYEDWHEQDEWLEKDMTSASLFPYAPASVCSFWRDIMSSLPECWGRVVIFVDPPATPLPIIESQLSWSRNRQLDVYITRRAFCDVDVDGWHERSQVVAIMSLIHTHIHRIRELSIDVMFSSSLPSILTEFHGNALMMLNLELKCRQDDGGSDRSESVSLIDRQAFQCPKLRCLTIDGRNWYEASRSDSQWTEKVASVTQLTICHFKPNPGESFSPHELLNSLPAISDLAILCIEDIVFDQSREPLDIAGLGLPSVEYIYLEDFHGFEFVEQIIRSLNPYNIWITRCTFEDIADGFDHFSDLGHGGELSLNMISCDFAPLLRLWHGHSLDIRFCPSFDDALLNTMGSQENGVFTCATYLEYFTINNCSNFSVAALQRFVESRLDLPSYDTDYTWDNQFTPRIRDIRFYGPVPSMSQAEQDWFNESLPGL